MRQHFRDKYLNNDKGVHTIEMGSLRTQGQTAMSAVEFVKPSVTVVGPLLSCAKSLSSTCEGDGGGGGRGGR